MGLMKAERGGLALKRAIHVARIRAGIASDMELARVSGVSYDTLMNWYGERTVPRPAQVRKIALATNVPFATLMDAYEGRELEPLALQDSIRALVEEMRMHRRQEAELLEFLGQLVKRA